MLSLAEPAKNRLPIIVSAYLLSYLLASFLDLSTTALALQQSGAHEGNAFVTSAQAYMSARAWIITAAAGIILAGFVVFAARNAGRVEDKWLLHPISSFASFYVNPWSPAAIGKSPLHMLSFTIAFVVMRLLAAGNNVLIHVYGFAPIGAPIQWLSRRMSPLFGFAAVIVPLFYLLAIAVSPLAARMLKGWKENHA